MALTEAFAHSASTNLSVQMRDITGIGVFGILDVFFNQTNTGPQRSGAVLLVVDGDVYTVHFTLAEDSIDQRTIQGYTKRKNPNPAGR